MSLKKSAINGLFWTFLDTGVSRGVGLIASILLARLLSPTDFGLMGMIYIFTSIAAAIVDSGLTASLVRSKNVNDIDFSTIFFTNMVLALTLYVVTFTLAPFIATFYQEPQLTLIIRVYAVLFIIEAFYAVQSCLFTRKMDFRSHMLMNIPGIIMGALIGICMAYFNYGVWSIIFMHLTTKGMYSVMYWLRSSWKPKMIFSYASLKRHFNFGYKLTLTSILNAGFNNIYNVIIGKFFSTQTLGQFDRGRVFSDYPVQILTVMIGKVTYPLFSGIQDEEERLKLAYKQILQVVFFITAPLMLLLSVIAEPLITLAIGNKWLQAALFFKILCLAGMLYPLHAFNLNILKVYGRSDWFLKAEVYKKIITVIIIVITLPFGIYGLVWSSVIISLLSLVINTHYSNKLVNYSLLQQLYDMRFTIIISAIMYGVIFSFLKMTELSKIYQVLYSIFIGVFIYVLLSYIFKVPSLKALWQLKTYLKK